MCRTRQAMVESGLGELRLFGALVAFVLLGVLHRVHASIQSHLFLITTLPLPLSLCPPLESAGPRV